MKYLIITAALLYANLTFAQDIPVANVPSVVLNVFNKSFPKSNQVEWEQEGEIYNAEFDIDWRDHEVWISKTGSILKHKKELKEKELPAIVKTYIQQNYAGYRIDDVDQYEVNKRFYYKIELKNDGTERKVIIDQAGKAASIVL